MKKLILFIVIIFTIGFITNNTAKSAERPYYILFENLEDQMGNGEGNGYPDVNTKISNLIDLYYWDPLTSREAWQPYCLRATFSPSTFSQYPITSFDFAVFILGDKGLNYSVGGITVMDKIQEMIDAGKDVIIIGYKWFSKASADPEANHFITETLGLIPEKVNLFAENTYIGFDIFGDSDSPLTAGHSMHFNGGYTRNDVYGEPSRLYRECDMFTVKPTSTFFAFDRTVAFGGTKYVGGVIDIGPSTIAIWSIDWANVAGSTADGLDYTYKKLIESFLQDVPNPEAYIESEYNEISMGSCEVGDSLYSNCSIRNFGRKPLVVTDIYLWDKEQTCFTIMKNPKSFTLEPNAMKKLMVRFKPTEEGDFMDDLIIESNSINCSYQKYYIGLEATGGEKLNYGACLSITSYPIDFGRIMTGKISFADVEVTNTGQANLIIDSIYFPDKSQKDFIYADEYKMPKNIISGSSFAQRIKFIPLIENAKYTTKMKIVTNGYNDLGWGKGIGYVTLVGETYSDKAGADIVVDNDELLFGKCSGKTDRTILIRNIGDEDLLVQVPLLDCDQENEEPFSFSPAEIPLIKTGEEFTLTVSFNPPMDKEYYCDLKLINNSSNPSKANMVIWLNGEGVYTSVETKDAAKDMDINVTPNPITDNSEIKLNIFEDSQRTLEITLVDMLGKEVKKIVNGVYSKGEYKFDLNKNNIASGKYLLVVKFGRTQENISIIVK